MIHFTFEIIYIILLFIRKYTLRKCVMYDYAADMISFSFSLRDIDVKKFSIGNTYV